MHKERISQDRICASSRRVLPGRNLGFEARVQYNFEISDNDNKSNKNNKNNKLQP
jgi:hypothetical protein